MPEIRILPEELQNQIAAGEVIERPASVVKELIENSVDASSTEINIEVLGAGRRLILVSDNGKGMDREDALLCTHPHATSKIKHREELFRIRTLGFRGEALSSIASVSRLIIKTGRNDEDIGTEVTVEGGRLIKTRDIPYRGTTVEVRNLFFNTPARKKFLKSHRTEAYHIIETVTEAALTNPAISFNLRLDGKEILNLPSARDIRERIHQIFGEEFLAGLVEIITPGLVVYTSKEDNYRPRRIHQYMFVNNRPVRDITLRSAVYRAYDNILPSGRHPVFFVYLSIDPEEVDFNVHPAKREVRFKNSEFVYRRLYQCLKDAFMKEAEDTVRREKKDACSMGSNFMVKASTSDPSVKGEFYTFFENPDEYRAGRMDFFYIGDLFVVYTDGDTLVIMDHHAAHERVLYEKIRQPEELKISCFLFPKQVRLNPREYRIIMDHLDDIRVLGIEIEDFGRDTCIVRAVPDFLFNADIYQIITDIAQSLIDGTDRKEVEVIRDNLAKTIACHKSVRSGHRLTEAELRELLKDLENCEDPEHCPHGRPTRIRFTEEALRRMFKRE
ncbi:MAG: DNA mismatch repair endonuclease MutL [Nitrospirae bacterium]|nr:DNA mismatch repair endonuclease MutL [Nitrospirota bacterium]